MDKSGDTYFTMFLTTVYLTLGLNVLQCLARLKYDDIENMKGILSEKIGIHLVNPGLETPEIVLHP